MESDKLKEVVIKIYSLEEKLDQALELLTNIK